MFSKSIPIVSLVQFWCQNCRKLRRRFPSGKIWLEGFAPCKKIDILQLWGGSPNRIVTHFIWALGQLTLGDELVVNIIDNQLHQKNIMRNISIIFDIFKAPAFQKYST